MLALHICLGLIAAPGEGALHGVAHLPHQQQLLLIFKLGVLKEQKMNLALNCFRNIGYFLNLSEVSRDPYYEPVSLIVNYMSRMGMAICGVFCVTENHFEKLLKPQHHPQNLSNTWRMLGASEILGDFVRVRQVAAQDGVFWVGKKHSAAKQSPRGTC